MPSPFTGLWRHPDFLRFWSAQTISLFGSSITSLALPLTAVLILDATPTQMGVLGATQSAPYLLFGLLAGAWVDRVRRRPVLVWTDIGRALLLASVPLAAVLHVLRIEQLYIVAFLVGVLTVFFDVAYMAFLPSLVRRNQLVEGNTKLEASGSLAHISGPGVAGALIQLLTAPLAIVVDALSFLLSALMVGWIRAPEPDPESSGERRSILSDIKQGLSLVLRNPLLRAMGGAAATLNIFDGMMSTVYLLYVTDLGVQSFTIGIIYGVGSAGGLLATLVGSRIVRSLGLGTAIISSSVLGGVAALFIPFVGSLPLNGAVAALGLIQFIRIFGILIYNINVISLRQAVTPLALQGRVNATGRVIAFSSLPIGALIGGVLGDLIGLRPTLMVAAIGILLSVLWLVFSPVRTLQEQPAPLPDLVPEVL